MPFPSSALSLLISSAGSVSVNLTASLEAMQFLDGSPTLIIQNGKLYRGNMKKAKLDKCQTKAGQSLALIPALHGALNFGPFTPLHSDIMGPFRLFAGMECAHGVVSMMHTLSGQAVLNGERIDFDGGREYRLATYRGASPERWSGEGAAVRQARFRLEADVLSAQGPPLRAPVQGQMTRSIRESLRAAVRYRFRVRDRLLFDHTDDSASFEFSAVEG